MNLERYGLTRAPFATGTDEDPFVALPQWEQSLSALSRCIEAGRGIAVLSGPPGSGKTSLCRELARRLSPRHLTAHLQAATFTTRRGQLQAILYELGQSYFGLTEQEARLRLLETIRESIPDRLGLVLIVDEADRLNDRMLEELRGLTNFEHDGMPLIRLVLCGNVALEERLTEPGLEGLNQRIVCHETLEPLSQEESARFLDERIVWAGGDGWEHVLTRPAMELLCLVSDGSPRCLEQLADRALERAQAAGESLVSVDAIRLALQELKELPLRWNEPTNLDRYSHRDWSEDEDDSRDAPKDHVSHSLAARTEHRNEEPDAVIEFGSDQPAAADQIGEPPHRGTSLDARKPEPEDDDEPATAFEIGADLPHAPEDEPADESPVETPAILEFGGGVEAESTCHPEPEDEPMTAQTDAEKDEWIELDVEDRYAALDRALEGQKKPVPRTATVPAPKAQATESPAGASSAKSPVGVRAPSREITGWLHDLSHDMQPFFDPPPETAPVPVGTVSCGYPSGMVMMHSSWGTLSQWDVVEPEWDSPREGAEPRPEPHADEAPSEAEAAAAPSPEPDEPRQRFSVESSAKTHPVPLPADPFAAVAGPQRRAEQPHEDPGGRPFSQLFTRLRKLRSGAAERLRSSTR